MPEIKLLKEVIEGKYISHADRFKLIKFLIENDFSNEAIVKIFSLNPHFQPFINIIKQQIELTKYGKNI